MTEEIINEKEKRDWKQFLVLTGVGVIICLLLLQILLVSVNQPQLSQEDKEFITQLEYSGGFCERLGLQSRLIVQQLEDGQSYGVPICVEYPDKNEA